MEAGEAWETGTACCCNDSAWDDLATDGLQVVILTQAGGHAARRRIASTSVAKERQAGSTGQLACSGWGTRTSLRMGPVHAAMPVIACTQPWSVQRSGANECIALRLLQKS